MLIYLILFMYLFICLFYTLFFILSIFLLPSHFPFYVPPFSVDVMSMCLVPLNVFVLNVTTLLDHCLGELREHGCLSEIQGGEVRDRVFPV